LVFGFRWFVLLSYLLLYYFHLQDFFDIKLPEI